jgi:hypothetical protein
MTWTDRKYLLAATLIFVVSAAVSVGVMRSLPPGSRAARAESIEAEGRHAARLMELAGRTEDPELRREIQRQADRANARVRELMEKP